MGVKWVMRPAVRALATATGALVLAGCATQSTVDRSASRSTDPTQATYTNEELNNTGRHDTAGAIEAIDPSVRISR